MPIDFLKRKKEESVSPETFEAYYLFKELSATGSFTPPPSPTFEFQPSDISLQSPSSPMVQVISPGDIFPPPSPRSSATSAIPSTVFPDTLSRAASTLYLALRLGTSLTGFHGHQSLEKDFQSTSFVGISLTYQRTNFTQSVCQRRVSKHFRIGSIIAFI